MVYFTAKNEFGQFNFLSLSKPLLILILRAESLQIQYISAIFLGTNWGRQARSGFWPTAWPDRGYPNWSEKIKKYFRICR